MTFRGALFVSAAVVGLSGVATPAWAQGSQPQTDTASAPASDADETGADIIVTATRTGRSGYDAPTPTKVLNAETLQQRAATNVGDFLNEVPAFRPSQTAQTNPQQNSGAGQTFADLRGLGNIRTLTLVDGRRHVPSASTGQVDLNLIPTILVERIEVVTGGASAAWGSDAISGVVNVILDKKLQGIKGDFSLGITDKGDNGERRASLAAGTSFADDRGHVVIGGEFVESDGVDSYLDRDWGRRSDELVSYIGAPPAGQPGRFYSTGVGSINFTQGGLILVNSGPLRGIQFGPGGTVLPYNYGTIVGVNSINNSASTPYGTTPFSIRSGLQLVLPVRRYTGLGHVDYELTDGITAFAEFGYGKTGSSFHTPPVRDVATAVPAGLQILRTNAFLPAPIAAIMDANAIPSFFLGRQFDDFGPVRARNYIDSIRGVVGLNGTIGSTFKWDAYYEYGRSNYNQHIENLRVESRFRSAVNSILVGGVPVCADPVARAAGCVALNPFGAGSPSAAAIAYVTGTLDYNVVNKQQVAAANISGEPFSTWAGPVSIAVGGEYREEKSIATADAISAASGFNYGNPKAFAGSFNVKEAYVETVIPLAKDAPFFHSLEFNGAVRYADYSTSGGVTTWKLGGTWEPVVGLRFRTTRSRDIRAPNNSELYSTFSTRATLVNPYNGVNGQFVVITQGSQTLTPEKADTITVGLVLQPSFLPGFQASVDFYDINVKKAISAPNPQGILDNCFADPTSSFCAFVDKTGTGAATVINSVTQRQINLASVRTRGVDFEMNYRFPMLGGKSTARVFGTYTKDLIVDDGLGFPITFVSPGIVKSLGSVINYAGQVGGFSSGSNVSYTNTPHWVLNGALTYEGGPFTTTVQGRYVGGGKVNNQLVDPSNPLYNTASPIAVINNDVNGRFYLNLSLSAKVINDGRKKFEVYGLVNNVLDADVPFPSTQISGLYDRIGRFFRAGVRFSY